MAADLNPHIIQHMIPVPKQCFSGLYLQNAPTYTSLITTKGTYTFSTACLGLERVKPWKAVTQ